MKWYIVGILCSIISIGCAASNREVLKELSASDEQIRREVEELKRQVVAPPALLRIERPDSLKDRLESLRREYARQIANLERQNVKQEREISQLRTLMAKLEGKAGTISRDEGPPGFPAIFRPGGYDVSSAYRAALEEYRAERFERAAGMFSEIFVVAPESDLADNAQYWLGECYYSQGDFPRAISAFQNVLTYPETEKNDDAQLKIAHCYEKTDDPKAALRALERLLRDHPRSEYAGRARAAIGRLRKGR